MRVLREFLEGLLIGYTTAVASLACVARGRYGGMAQRMRTSGLRFECLCDRT